MGSNIDDAQSTQAGATHTTDSEQEHSKRSSGFSDGHLISAKSSKTAIRRTKNSTNRQLTFSKCHNGLLRKAEKLSVLCDAEVAVIIYSATGQLSEYATSSMANIIKRYEDVQPLNAPQVLLQEGEFWKDKALLVRKQAGYLNDLESYMIGGNAINLSYNELHNVEMHLESILEKIRARKNELREVRTEEIIKKGKSLWTKDNLLKRKLEELLQGSAENATSCVSTRSGLSTSKHL